MLKPDVEIASGHGFLALALPYAKKSERFPPSIIFHAGENYAFRRSTIPIGDSSRDEKFYSLILSIVEISAPG